MKRILSVLAGFVAVVVGLSADFQINDQVALVAQHPAGVPVRDQPGDSRYYRWPDRTEGVVVALQGSSVQVEAAGKRGWILPKYLTSLAAPIEEGVEAMSIVIGAWNLEHFHDGAKRGFPELQGSRALPPRTTENFVMIADAIRSTLGIRVLMLSEIAGVPGQQKSVELDRLIGLLGPNWKYAIGSSGGINGGQRVALLWDEGFVEALSIQEISIPEKRVGGDDIFDRDPLIGHFRVRRIGGAPANDFVVVALHLASGQGNVSNHNAAMERFRSEYHALRQVHSGLQAEKDVIVGGDLNASRYDNKQENFWVGFDGGGLSFTTLSPDDEDDYLPTRMKGNPLFPGSRIDYLLASAHVMPLLALPSATVHHELVANNDFLGFRRNYSDHFPVTVTLLVSDDND